MKSINRIIQPSILLLLIIAPFLTSFTYNGGDYTIIEEGLDNLDPISSDVAGTDLYAEQISAYVAGSKSIIRQSLFTNDTNIFTHFDANDPAFYKCNILISATNGLTPEMFPSILTDNIFGSSFALSYNSFLGFLLYDDAVSATDAETRAERALEIIKRKFMIDLIMVNSTIDNFFPFIGHYPNWDHFFGEVMQNLPMDGYWKALDVNRLTSDSYINNQHLSSTYLLINSLEFIENGINISTDQIDFNLGTIDLSFIENMNMEDIMDQLNNIMADYGSLYGNLSQFMGAGANESIPIDPETLDQMSELFGSFALSNDSHYSTLVVQYEGKSEGITRKLGTNEYTFNLFDALGYSGNSLLPSAKIYIAMVGAFMSELDVNILCTDIIDSTPHYFELYEYMIEQIGFLLFLAGVDFDVQTLSEYSLELIWVNEDGFFRAYVRPVNQNNPDDLINTLGALGFQGFPFIPTGILNPITDFIVSYNVSYTEPNMVITKNLVGENASYSVYNNYTMNVTAVNIANISVWGIPTDIPIDIELLLTAMYGAELASLIYTQLGLYVETFYPESTSVENFLGVDVTPKIFYFDTYGLGINDYAFPNIYNVVNLWPYSEQMADDMTSGPLNGALLLLGLTPQQIQNMADLFDNTESVWNPENWVLADRGDYISYLTTNSTIPTTLDTFERFYSYNFTITDTPYTLPAILNGQSISGTNSSMALETDNKSWSIESVQNIQHDLGLQFIFTNDTTVNLVNNSIERVSIEINYTSSSPVSIEIFNFTTEEFVSCSSTADLVTIINDSYTYAYNKYNNSLLDWMFYDDDPGNYTVLLQITSSDAVKFNVSINDFNVSFSNRQINAVEQGGARIQYANEKGTNQYDKTSNSITLSTYNMASIIANSTLTTHSAYTGEENTYTLNLKNIGSDDAENLSVSLLIPGIMKDNGGFSLSDNNLTYSLPKLAPSEEISLNFTFYTPNSGSINSVVITYNNPNRVENLNTTTLNSTTNEIYYSAPVDYETRFPYVRILQIDYATNDSAPVIGAYFNLTANIKNIGQVGIAIPDINFTMNDRYDSLERIGSQTLGLTNISYLETKNITITLRKNDWKAYYYPPINLFESSESRTIQIASSSSIILGVISLDIDKTVNVSQVEIGDHILVTIVVENTGTITVKNISLSDIVSFTQITFSLVDGKLVNKINSLDAGETITFTYSIRAVSQAYDTLKPASVTFYYLLKEKSSSQDIDVKIIIPILRQILAVIIPCIIGLVVLASYYYQTRRYKADKYELQRLELEIFDLASRDAIIKIEHTMRERLNILSKDYRLKHPMKPPAKKPVPKPAPVKNEPVKNEPVKKEPTKEEPVKQTPVKKEPVKKELVEKKATEKKVLSASSLKEKWTSKESAQEMITQNDFDALMKKTVNELRVIAKDNNITIPPNTRKADLAQMIVYQTQDKNRGAKK